MAQLAWYERPPDGPLTPSLPLWRPKANSHPIKGLILSDSIVGVMLHWVGRSVPHRPPDANCKDCDARAVPPRHCQKHACPGCDADRPMRWEGYLAIWTPTTGTTAIVAVTPGVLEAFETYRAQHNTLRGAELQLMRVGLKAHSPITVIIKRGDIPPGNLPRAPELEPILANIWGVNRHAKEQGADELERKPHEAVAGPRKPK